MEDNLLIIMSHVDDKYITKLLKFCEYGNHIAFAKFYEDNINYNKDSQKQNLEDLKKELGWL